MPPTPTPAFDVHLHLSRYWPDPPQTFYRRDLDFTLPGLLAELDGSGITGGLLLPEEHTPTIAEALREGREASSASAGRLRYAATVDPTRGPEEIAAAIDAWGRESDLAAIKLYPGYQPFYPHDPGLAPLYEFAGKRRLPVMFHQGDTLDPAGMVKFARPIEVDEVAVRFRDVRFVICHFGNPWIEEAAEVVYKNENVYADTSGLFWPPDAPYYEAMIARAQARLADAIATIGRPDRVLYGSDWPLIGFDRARGLVDGLAIPAEDRARILAGNAAALFTPRGARAHP